jgi:hypothetical protein
MPISIFYSEQYGIGKTNLTVAVFVTLEAARNEVSVQEKAGER